MRVIGTVGHVDHGKSKLIEALAGIDPDRLKKLARVGVWGYPPLSSNSLLEEDFACNRHGWAR